MPARRGMSWKVPLAMCPKCGTFAVRRSRRRGPIERWILGLFGSLPYRCQACRRRFYGKNPIPPKSSGLEARNS